MSKRLRLRPLGLRERERREREGWVQALTILLDQKMVSMYV